jgi:hypothetical protein
MYDESLLMNVIRTNTGYSVEYAEDSTIDLINVNTVKTPRVYVGHIGIKLEYPQYVYANGYNELENPEILLTSIQFICERSSLAVVRTNIANAYKGFTPFAGDSDYSSLVFIEGNMVAKTGTKVWWQEVVGLIFPRIS